MFCERVKFNQNRAIPTLRFQTEMDPVAAVGLELSSVFTPVLSHISPSDLDHILEKYFEVERRYDPKTKFIEVDALTNLSVKSQHLKWKLPCGLENASLYFRYKYFRH